MILLGEVHDNAAQHALRLQALQRWIAAGARPALVMEQFDRDRQAALDALRERRPQIGADALIAAVGRPGWQWEYYRPYVALALAHDLPIIAANLSRDEARRVMSEGLQAAELQPPVPEDLIQAQAKIIAAAHCGGVDGATASRMALAQIARDQTMARALEAHAASGAVLLAGNGHVRTDLGVPRWFSPAVRARSVAIGLVEGEAEPSPPYDRVVITPAQARPDPCGTK